MKVLCVHGVAGQEARPGWKDEWTTSIVAGLTAWGDTTPPEVEFLIFDDIFAQNPLTAPVWGGAFLKLLGSLAENKIGDLFGQTRGLADIPDRLRWTAGMVAQWADNDKLRAQLNALLVKTVQDFGPDLVVAHSLGSLIAYDTFSDTQYMPLIKGRTLVTCGSQVGNPAVRNAFGGRLRALDGIRNWFHLFNPNDHVLTAQIDLHDQAFHQVLAPFTTDHFFNHDLNRYLTHPNAIDSVWRPLVQDDTGSNDLGTTTRSLDAAKESVDRPRVRRALLVGINVYEGSVPTLEGCVNDVFEMSATLQDAGFDPDEIRIVLDERATASNILDRMNWLLEGACPGDDRVLFYSGHGAQIPVYNALGQPESNMECLVPHDFAWTPETMITDRQIADLYSQLPYECNFVMILDCCHAGGIWREGGGRVRGIDPPDDIRHRSLRWDGEREMWVPRTLPDINPDAAQWDDAHKFVGEDQSTRRLGRATDFREMTNDEYEAIRARKDHAGPFLPIIIEACGENEKAHEYRHGVTSYGAFTYTLTRTLRNIGRAGGEITFGDLVQRVNETIRELGYDQTPAILAPSAVIGFNVPYVRRKQPPRQEAPPA